MSIKRLLIFFAVILIVCSLVFTGIGNTSKNNSHEAVVAKIGKEKILLSEYKPAYQNELEYVQQILGHTLTEEQIEGFNVKYIVLKRLIEKKLIFNLINELNLKVGKQSVKEHIKSTKYFQNEQGEFDKDKFLGILKNANITEAEYIKKVQETLPIAIFMSCLFGEPTPAYVTFDDDIINKIYHNHYQRRIADIVRVTPSVAGHVPSPEDQMLQDLYEQHKSDFYTPEYRTIKYALIEPKHFESQVSVSEEEVNELIKQQKLNDQRDVFNLVFTEHEKAKEAEKALKEENMDFEKIVSVFGNTTLKDIKINNIVRNTIPEESMKEAIFSLKEGEVSNLLQSSIGWHLVKVQSIHKISDEDLVTLKLSITKKILEEKSEVLMYNTTTEIEAQGGLLTIEEISSKYDINLDLHTIGPIDADENDQDGNKIHDLPKINSFIPIIFSVDNHKTHFFSSSVGPDFHTNYFYVTIIDVIASKSKDFQESKPSVIKLWHSQFIDKEMYKIANDLESKLQAGVDPSQIEEIELSTKQILNRFEIAATENPAQNYPKALVDEIFTIEKDNLTKPVKDKNDVLVGILREIQDVDNNANELIIKTMKDKFARNNIDALKEQLNRYLYNKYKIEINNSVVDNISYP